MRLLFLSFWCILLQLASAQERTFYKEKYRPQFHFTPPIHWMNDPNGLFYLKGEYHLFYQYNPMGNRWGHMSWGHAVSKDLVYWQPLPLAIPELADTMIFSGSCVVDQDNTSGFAKKAGQVPVVAIYTGSYGKLQAQHIAYSLDAGRTWTQYDHNPVLDINNSDFRDPSVFWYEPGKKWVMSVVLALEKKVQFYSSSNLRNWTLTGSFGPAGDTTGIWECPSLFQVPVLGKPAQRKWVLMLSPAPYMQYFIGEFDGNNFVSDNSTTRIYRPDYGPDYYAAIPFNNTTSLNGPAVTIGWINNWNYANDIPTTPWKSAASLPRNLYGLLSGDEWLLVQKPIDQVNKLRTKGQSWKDVKVNRSKRLPVTSQTFETDLSFKPVDNSIAGIRLAKSGDDHYLEIGYDAARKLIYLDRSKAGDTSFHMSFGKLSRFEKVFDRPPSTISLQVFFDKSIVEIFVNGGEAVLTAQLFPGERQNEIELFSNGQAVNFSSVRFWEIKPIW